MRVMKHDTVTNSALQISLLISLLFMQRSLFFHKSTFCLILVCFIHESSVLHIDTVSITLHYNYNQFVFCMLVVTSVDVTVEWTGHFRGRDRKRNQKLQQWITYRFKPLPTTKDRIEVKSY